MKSLAPIVRMWQLAWWKWARADLTRKDPMHPDLNVIVRRIAELEEM